MKKSFKLIGAVLALAAAFSLAGCPNVPPDPVNAQTPVISAQPQNAYYQTGVTATALTVTAAVTDGGTLSYQWYSNSSNSTTGGTPVGSNSNSLSPATTVEGITYYYVIVTNTIADNGDGGQKTAAATSNIATINVTNDGLINAQPPVINTQPQGANYTTKDTPTALTVIAAVTDGGALSYQWYSNGANSTTGGTPVGTNSNSYIPVISTTGTTYYYVVVTNTIADNDDGGQKTATATSGTAAIIVTPAGSINAQAPSINTQPQSASYTTADTAAALTVIATVTDGGAISYQWYSNGSNSTTGGIVVGTNSNNYTPEITSAGTTYYYVVVTNTITDNDDGGQKTATRTSNVVTVTVEPPKSDTKAITAFTFTSPSATGVINDTAKTISVTVPNGTVVTNLTPNVMHTGVSYSPTTAQNFTNPVTYTVTAEDGSTQEYEVTVTVAVVQTWTITWNLKGGTPSAHPNAPNFHPTEIADGGTITARPDMVNPNKTNCTFVGWFKDFEGTQEYTFPITVTSDLILYAKWLQTEPKIYYGTYWPELSSVTATSFTLNTGTFSVENIERLFNGDITTSKIYEEYDGYIWGGVGEDYTEDSNPLGILNVVDIPAVNTSLQFTGVGYYLYATPVSLGRATFSNALGVENWNENEIVIDGIPYYLYNRSNPVLSDTSLDYTLTFTP